MFPYISGSVNFVWKDLWYIDSKLDFDWKLERRHYRSKHNSSEIWLIPDLPNVKTNILAELSLGDTRSNVKIGNFYAIVLGHF